MKAKGQGTFPRLRNKLLVGLRGPQALAFLPAFALAAFWLGGEGMLVAAALGLPILYIAVGGFSATGSALSDGVVDETAVVSKTTAIALAGRALARAREGGLGTACILVEAEALRQLALTRLRNLLRRGDQVFRLADDRFILLLAPSTRLDLETLLQLAARLQTSLEEPATIENATRFFSASVGFCGSARLRDQAKGNEFFDAASIALSEAVANGPSAIRAWSDGMQEAHTAQKGLLREVEKALQNGQIQP